MKKLLLAIPLVAGASWAGASIYSGTQTQSAYDQLLVQLNEMKPLTLVNESYSAGFLNSTAVTKVMDSAAPDAKVLFRLQHDIDHAPVAVVDSSVQVAEARIKTTLLQDDSLSESAIEFMQGFVESEPFEINTQVGYNGDTRNHLLVSAYHHQEDDIEVRFGGLYYNADVVGDAVKGRGELGEITVDGQGNLLTVSSGVITTDLTRISQAVYAGLYGVEFDKLTVSSDEGATFDFALESLGVNSDTTVADDQLSTRANIHVGKIDSQLPLDSASLEVGMSNLSISGIKQYVEAVSQMPMSDTMLSSDPEMIMEVMSTFLPAIGPGSALDYKFKFSNAGGDASLDYGISVIEDSSPYYPVGGLASISTVRDLLNITQFEAHLKADADAIDQTPLAMFMMAPQAQQVIVADGSSYTADITLKELIVYINGNPLSLELMMGEILDTPIAQITEI
ncbi:DUF945 family protein [Granulosicoccus antarcticus]|uniref:DUF945 domain-containing protein n=1 Tax=Granulosicoccus antarcticus IMCC3135 TaxID=1192854 RepID=A0A2Z2NMY7_9GAMM|nr:DUF945 family protein [Granulosicoccus antarcticus]ASJ72593.1 hypothetical protein IMCC3135_12525 [Granulosicoccus antarcticus IMCC3135]